MENLIDNIKKNEPIIISKKTRRINYQKPIHQKYETSFKYKCTDKTSQKQHMKNLVNFIITKNEDEIKSLTEYMRSRYVNMNVLKLLKENEIKPLLKLTTIKKFVRNALKVKF